MRREYIPALWWCEECEVNFYSEFPNCPYCMAAAELDHDATYPEEDA